MRKIHPFLKEAILLTGIFAVYFFSGKAGLSLAYLNPSASAIWPPTGITLAAFLLFGYRVWPSILLGAFMVNITTAGSAVTCLGIALGNLLEGLAGAYAVNKIAGGCRVFDQPKNIVKFALFACLGSTLISATIGVGVLSWSGHVKPGEFFPTWLTWWLGDTTGNFTVAPFLILWAEDWRIRWERKKFWEAVLIGASMSVVSLIIFYGLLPAHVKNYPIEFLCFLFVLWAAFRFDCRGAASATLLLFGIAVTGTLSGFGPFSSKSSNESLLLLQAFIGFVALASLITAAVVSQRRKAEEEVMHLASIVGSSEDAIIGKTLEGTITSWNAGAQKIFGYSSQEIIGQSIARLVPQDQDEERKTILMRLARGERISQFETKRVRKDGRVIDLSMAICPILDRSGQIVGASVIAQDITGRKLLEKQKERQSGDLAASNAELARRERIMQSLLEDIQMSKVTLEDQKKSLQVANLRLEAMSALKDEFVATVSHELRTPLTAIKEGISLLVDRLLGPINTEQADFLKTVDQNIDRLTDLINNMLDLSKIEAGRLRVTRRQTDVNTLVREMLQNYKAMAGRRRLQTHLAFVPPVFADEARVMQILGNFFSNAVKFTREDGKISVTVEETKDGFVEISVQDDGIGIHAGDLPKLFKKFSQVGQWRSPGTGLGLALCKDLVELHGGHISVDSAPGQGSRFIFTLPIFSLKLAMQENFKTQKQLADHMKQEQVGLIVIEVPPVLKEDFKSHIPGESYAIDVELFLRKHLNQDDSVFWFDPDHLVVLSVADREELSRIVRRLANALSERMAVVMDRNKPASLTVGTAIYPSDGWDVLALYEKSLSRLERLEIAV